MRTPPRYWLGERAGGGLLRRRSGAEMAAPILEGGVVAGGEEGHGVWVGHPRLELGCGPGRECGRRGRSCCC